MDRGYKLRNLGPATLGPDALDMDCRMCGDPNSVNPTFLPRVSNLPFLSCVRVQNLLVDS
jgi:hypothetical protein